MKQVHQLFEITKVTELYFSAAANINVLPERNIS